MSAQHWTVIEDRRQVACFSGDAEGKEKATKEAATFGGRAVLVTIPDEDDDKK